MGLAQFGKFLDATCCCYIFETYITTNWQFVFSNSISNFYCSWKVFGRYDLLLKNKPWGKWTPLCLPQKDAIYFVPTLLFHPCLAAYLGTGYVGSSLSRVDEPKLLVRCPLQTLTLQARWDISCFPAGGLDLSRGFYQLNTYNTYKETSCRLMTKYFGHLKCFLLMQKL